MPQTGYTPIQIYSSSTPTNAPSAGNLTNDTKGSELAINIADGKLFYKDNASAVQVIGWKTTPTTAGGTGLTSWTAGDLPYYATGTTLSKLGIGSSGQILTSTGTAPQWSTLSGVAVTTFSAGTTGLTPSVATSGAVTLAGTLIAANGGTGQSSYAVGDILYASTTTALSKLADVATGNALISGGVGVAPSWGKIGLTTHVSGTLPTANGGTNLTSFTANGVMYASSTSALSTSAALTFDGTNFATTGYGYFGSSVYAGSASQLVVGGSASDSAIRFQGTNLVFAFGSSSELARLTSSGSLLLGQTTNTGSGKLAVNGRIVSEVAGSDSFAGTYYFNGTGGAANIQMGATGGIAFWTYNSGWGERARVFTSGGVSIGNTTDPGSTNLSVTGTGKFGTTVGVGAATPAASGAGITFPATQSASSDANTLDDYEEGTWTPTDTSGAGLSLTIVSATYTKIGRLVTLQAEITYPSTASSANSAIGGLPFTPASNGAASFYAGGAAGPVAQIGTDLYPANSIGAGILNSTFSTKTVYITTSYRT